MPAEIPNAPGWTIDEDDEGAFVETDTFIGQMRFYASVRGGIGIDDPRLGAPLNPMRIPDAALLALGYVRKGDDAEVLRAALSILDARRGELLKEGGKAWRPAGLGEYIEWAADRLEAEAKGGD